MIRIGFDGCTWQTRRGDGEYTRALWRAVNELDSGADLSLTMLHPDWQDLTAEPDLKIGHHLQARAALLRVKRTELRFLQWEQIGLPRTAAAIKANVLHANAVAPMFSPCPVVVTIHDLIPLVLPEFKASTSSRGYRLRTMISARSSRRARMIITDSESSKRDIVRLLKVPAARVNVIPLAASEKYHPFDEQAQAEARTRLKLPAEYIFYIGSFLAYKNVFALLQAFAQALPNLETPPKLVIAGALPNPTLVAANPALDVQGEAQRLGIADQVIWLGMVSEEDKVALYAAAKLFVFPSLYEGFGLSPLEAMACGVPVVCSNRTSLPEVVGDGGLMVDPTVINQFSATLVEVLNSAEMQAKLRAAGLRRAALFSWQRTAQQTLELYCRIAKRQSQQKGAK